MSYLHFAFSTKEFRDPEDALAESVNRIHGKRLADWLVGALRQKGLDATDAWAEDHGWDFSVAAGDCRYICACSLAIDDDTSAAEAAEGHVTLHKARTLMDKLRGRNKLAADDGIAQAIRAALTAHSAVRNVEEDIAA